MAKKITPATLADRIVQIRGPNRSQREFGRQLGVFQQNIWRYERGTKPCHDFLVLLGRKEKVNLNWLLLGEGRMRRAA